MSRNDNAFSLVELSIVLVILGLLVGGVLSGQSLIHAAELRTVTNDLQRYNAAINTFRDKYFALPGDMPNAVKFWGAQAGATTDGYDSTCSALTTPATSTATCNGNGNGYIGDTQNATEQYERYRFWQHLQNASLIEGQLSGVIASGAGYGARSSIIGTNVPRSKVSGVGYSMDYDSFATGPTKGKNFFVVGTTQVFAGSTLESAGAGFKNEDVWNVDTKIDDGKPLTGVINTYAYGNFGIYCANAANTDYDLSRSDIVCSFNYSP